VSGPISGGLHGRAWFSTAFDVAEYGYAEEEYFFSGSASAIGKDLPAAPYASRMLVYRPIDAGRFSGTTVVEWNNVSGEFDLPIDFEWAHPQVFADGDAYVQVTVQQAGLCGIDQTGAAPVSSLPAATCLPLTLKGFDPVRYAPLTIPSDDYSYDMFSQAAQAVRHPRGVDPLRGLSTRRLIATGESQSAVELDDYISNGADDRARLFDGFLIDADAQGRQPSAYRVPALHIWSAESVQDVKATSGPNHVIWAVAGASHTDSWWLQQTADLKSALLGLPLRTRAEQAVLEEGWGSYGQEGLTANATCIGDTEFPRRYVVDAALADLKTWISGGPAAPTAPNLALTGAGKVLGALPPAAAIPGLPTQGMNLAALATPMLAEVRDSAGNAVGGVRLPLITVPVAAYDGGACALLGTSVPFASQTLQSRYPTHRSYVDRMLAATKASVTSRFMTMTDGVDLMRRACGSAIPAWGTTPAPAQPVACSRLRAELTPAPLPSRPTRPNASRTPARTAAPPVVPPAGSLAATGPANPLWLPALPLLAGAALAVITRRKTRWRRSTR
jgi:hypothetical protein